MGSFRSRARDTGSARAQQLASRYGRELRIARVNAGLTQRQLARAAGVSQQEVSNAERGRADISLLARCQLTAACGQELAWRLYPVASVSLRDSGQLSLAQAIVSAAHHSWYARLEVPVAPGDPRAADLLLTGPREIVHIEIERALVDLQAQLRAAQLKRELLAQASSRAVRLVIAVPDTHATRTRLAPFAQLLAQTLPTPSRRIWTVLRGGEPLGGDGILFVRAAHPWQPTKRLSRTTLTP